jgi:hypothetical protein
MRTPPLTGSPALIALAAEDQPPTELKPYLARLRQAGATEVRIDRRTDEGVMFELSTAGEARGTQAVVSARSPRVLASWLIDWESSTTPIRNALEGVIVELGGYDQIARLRFAATDMELTAHAAEGLIEAREDRGSARVFERVIETGMVVTYCRPFLKSSQAPIGENWWPKDEADRALHDEIVDLRGEYHAHAEQTSMRSLEIMRDFHHSGRPVLAESWSMLPVGKLISLKDLANRQAEVFRAEADRLEVELFGAV